MERLVPEMIYYVSRGTLNSTHSLTHSLNKQTCYRICCQSINGRLVCLCVCPVSDDVCSVQQELVKRRSSLLQKYIHRDVKFELEALYAVQLIVHKHGHPYGL